MCNEQHADESSSTCAECYLQHPSASVSPYGCLRQEGLARPHFNLSASYYKQVGKHVPAQNQACAYSSCDICCADTCVALTAIAFSISWCAMIAFAHKDTLLQVSNQESIALLLAFSDCKCRSLVSCPSILHS